nr:hypothetical protein Itr_chr12CG14080 [Ipomoea trifida]
MGCQPKCGTAFSSDFDHVEVTAHVGLSPRSDSPCKTAHVYQLTSPHGLSADTHGRQLFHAAVKSTDSRGGWLSHRADSPCGLDRTSMCKCIFKAKFKSHVAILRKKHRER